jgi:hypothetical protein
MCIIVGAYSCAVQTREFLTWGDWIIMSFTFTTLRWAATHGSLGAARTHGSHDAARGESRPRARGGLNKLRALSKENCFHGNTHRRASTSQDVLPARYRYLLHLLRLLNRRCAHSRRFLQFVRMMRPRVNPLLPAELFEESSPHTHGRGSI